MPARESDSVRAGKNVSMQVDQAGRDIESGDIDDLAGLCRRNIRGHGCDQAIADGDVGDGADLVFGIDDVGALQQKVIRGLCEQGVHAQQECW